MKTKEVLVHIGRTLTRGYESTRIDLAQTVKLDEGESAKEVKKKLLKTLKEEMAQEVQEIHAEWRKEKKEKKNVKG